MLLPSRLTLGLGAALLAVIVGWAGTMQYQRKVIHNLSVRLELSKIEAMQLENAVEAQNDAIERAAAAGRRKQEAAEQAVKKSPGARKKIVDAMTNAPAGLSVEEIDRLFLESLE